MKKLFVLIAAACMTYTAAFAQTVKPFKEGERAVFLGNSITDGGHYHSYIWLYYMTRFPDMPIRVFNGGIGGDTAYEQMPGCRYFCDETFRVDGYFWYE